MAVNKNNPGRKVFAHPTYIHNKTTFIHPHDTIALVPEIFGPNGKMQAPITYKSDNPDILSVDDQGNVTGLKEGYGEILAYSCGKLARKGLDVISIPRGIKGFTGHRGFRHLAPENTLPSFQMAIDAGCDYVETDIAVTKDRQLVLFHDKKSVKRMLDADVPVNDLTFEEIRSLPFVGGVDHDKYDHLTVPTFEEYLDLIAPSSSNPMIELKDETLSKQNEDLLVKIRDMIDAHHLTHRARVTSAIKENLLAYEKINKEHELWYITEEDFKDLDMLKEHHWNLSIEHKNLDRKFLQQVIDAGLKVDVWIINDPKEAKKLLTWPITSMTSDICLFDHDDENTDDQLLN